jgi:hypothetical protein
MLVDEVRRTVPKVISEEQRKFCLSNGYLLLESTVSISWLRRLHAATDEMIERSWHGKIKAYEMGPAAQLQSSDSVLRLRQDHVTSREGWSLPHRGDEQAQGGTRDRGRAAFAGEITADTKVSAVAELSFRDVEHSDRALRTTPFGSPVVPDIRVSSVT